MNPGTLSLKFGYKCRGGGAGHNFWGIRRDVRAKLAFVGMGALRNIIIRYTFSKISVSRCGGGGGGGAYILRGD